MLSTGGSERASPGVPSLLKCRSISAARLRFLLRDGRDRDSERNDARKRGPRCSTASRARTRTAGGRPVSADEDARPQAQRLDRARGREQNLWRGEPLLRRLGDVDALHIATKTISGLYDGAPAREPDQLSIQTAAGFIVEEPQYVKLAARLLATYIEKEVGNQEIHAFSVKLGSVRDRGFYVNSTAYPSYPPVKRDPHPESEDGAALRELQRSRVDGVGFLDDCGRICQTSSRSHAVLAGRGFSPTLLQPPRRSSAASPTARPR